MKKNAGMLKIGFSYFFRTVTYHIVGKMKAQHKNFVELESASWIADSGRFADFLKNGTPSEVEPVGQVFVNLDTVTEIFPYKHQLPTEQK
jgi:hypothetical protein